MNYFIVEEEISMIGVEFFEGYYGVWNYMMLIDILVFKKFVVDFKVKYGVDCQVVDFQELVYNMVYLWKVVVEKVNSFDDNKVCEVLVGIEFDVF